MNWVIAQINEGFAIQIPDAGDYTLLFQVQDARGAYSKVIGFDIHVVPYESYSNVEGSFTSAKEVKTEIVSVDYSITPSAFLLVERTGDTYIKFNVFNADGTQIGSEMYLNAIANNMPYRLISLPKPSSATGNVNYTVKLQANSSIYSTSGYRVSTGDMRDLESLVGGLGNAMEFVPSKLPTSFATSPKNRATSSYIPTEKELYFIYTPEQAISTITLYGDDSGKNLRFKVLQYDSYEPIYDSNTDPYAIRKKFMGKFTTCHKARVRLQTGTPYYVVVYTPENLRTQSSNLIGSFNLLIGDPTLYTDATTLTAMSSVTGYRDKYSDIAYIDAWSLPETSYLHDLTIKGSTANNIMADWRITDTNEYTRRYINTTYAKFSYEWESTNKVPGCGMWQYQFKCSNSKSSFTFTPQLFLLYSYEMGDYVPVHG